MPKRLISAFYQCLLPLTLCAALMMCGCSARDGSSGFNIPIKSNHSEISSDEYNAIESDGGSLDDGTAFSWEISDNTLTISGTENIPNYSDARGSVYPPWQGKSFDSVVIEPGIKRIGDRAFYQCKSLVNVQIPNTVTDIGYYAFYECESLENIRIPVSVTSIDYGAFDCTAWYENQPDGVTYIGSVLYDYKGDMPDNTKISVRDGTTVIADFAFSACRGLVSITLSDTVTTIGNEAFSFCENLESIIMPDSVSQIGHAAFHFCLSLKSVEIPHSVSYIAEQTFYQCWNLESVTIPSSVTSIETGAFYDCKKLKKKWKFRIRLPTSARAHFSSAKGWKT